MANVARRKVPLKDRSQSYDGDDSISTISYNRYSGKSQNNDENDQNRWMSLLPSKQNLSYATVRLRNNERNRTVRSLAGTVRGLMLFRSFSSDSELANLPNAFNSQENVDQKLELEQIKELPVSMADKREEMYKNNIVEYGTQSINNRKLKRKKLWRGAKQKLNDYLTALDIWQRGLKKIEGNYGTGVATYFLYVKWLTILNFFIFLMILSFLIIPTVTIGGEDTICEDWDELCNANVLNCTDPDCRILSTCTNYHPSFINVIQDIVQGTGDIESTILFYGYYRDKTVEYLSFGRTMHYNLPLAYILVIITVLFLSLFLVIRQASKGIRFKFHEGDEKFYRYCNLVFGGWDFCIDNEKAAQMKKTLISNEIQACVDADKFNDKKKSRTSAARRRLYLLRFVIFLIHAAILGGSAYLIYIVFKKSYENLLERDATDQFTVFLYEFLPSLTIVSMNILAPLLFKFLIDFEKYSPNFTIFMLLVRTVLLRLSSIIILYANLYINVRGNCYQCWETYVGQQIYRLALTDFAVHVFLTFFVNFPRALVADKFARRSKFIEFTCEQTFDLPKHVLDVTYTQTLCWLGAFYAPLLPAISVIIFLFMFYIKKFVCLFISKPGNIAHRTSRRKFMNILLVAYVVATFPVIYTIAEMEPSRTCGPFRGLSNAWTVVYNAVLNTPAWVDGVFDFIASPPVGIGLFIVLIVLLYYYSATINANKHMIKALKAQVVFEGKDKNFLIQKLSEKLHSQQILNG